jgi:hypothetical protein
MDTIITNLQKEIKKRAAFVNGIIEAIDIKKANMDWSSEEQTIELMTLRDTYTHAENTLGHLRRALVSLRQARGEQNIDVFYPENF